VNAELGKEEKCLLYRYSNAVGFGFYALQYDIMSGETYAECRQYVPLELRLEGGR
jgi:hypothetical protein